MRSRYDVIFIFTGQKLSGRKGIYEPRRFYIHAPHPSLPYITYGKNQIDSDWLTGITRWNYKGEITLYGSKIYFDNYFYKLKIDDTVRMWDIIIDNQYFKEVLRIFRDIFGWGAHDKPTIDLGIYNANEEAFWNRFDVHGGSSINKNYNMNKSYIKRKSTKKNKNKKMMKKTKKTKKSKKFKKIWKKTNN